MNDLSHDFSGDLQASAVGDLLTSDGVTRSNQRILRRLLTNPGDYIWHPDYGAGLPARIGSTLNVDELTGLIRSQMFQEASVSHDPEPQIEVTPIPDGASVRIGYVVDGTPASLSFSVGP